MYNSLEAMSLKCFHLCINVLCLYYFLAGIDVYGMIIVTSEVAELLSGQRSCTTDFVPSVALNAACKLFFFFIYYEALLKHLLFTGIVAASSACSVVCYSCMGQFCGLSIAQSLEGNQRG